MPDSEIHKKKGNIPFLSLFFMLILYFLTLLLSLWLSPLFLRSGFQAFGEEGAFNVKWALCYVAFFLIFSLLLVYVIRRKKKRPVKYALILSLWVGLFYTLIPLYTAGFSTSEWEPLDAGNVFYSTQIGEDSVFFLTDHGPMSVKINDNVIERRIWNVGGIVSQKSDKGQCYREIPVIYGTGETVSLFQRDSGFLTVYDPRDGFSTSFHFTPERHPFAVISPPPGICLSDEDNITTLFFTFQKYGDEYYGSFDITIPPFFNWSLYGHLPKVINLSSEPHTILSSAEKEEDLWIVEVLIGKDLVKMSISRDKPVEVEAVFHDLPLEGVPTAISQCGNLTLIGTDKGLVHVVKNGRIERNIQLSPPIKKIQPVNLYGGYSHQVLVLSGRGSLNIIAGKDSFGEVFSLSETLQGFKNDPDTVFFLNGGDSVREIALLVISDEKSFFTFPYTSTAATYGEIYALLTATVLIALLRARPSWWLLDSIGVVAGAGLISILGISFAPLPLIILFVVLAVYDAIAVYRTKHMLQLAESAVEAQVPVMLVFPHRRGYRLPKGLGLTKKDRKRREAFFMGLGDVVIPGSLVISAYTYLPSTTTVFNLPYNVLASLLVLFGILTAHLILLWVLLRGKPQAGLPFLNGGALLGLAIAYLLSFL